MKTDPTDTRVRHFEWKNATFGDIKRRPHSQLTSHTDSRLPAPSRCLSAESCPHVQTSPAASLWPGFQCSRSKWSGTASLPSPCCFRGRHSCAECVRVATGCSKTDELVGGHETGKPFFWFSHFSVKHLQRTSCTLSSLKEGFYLLKSESIFLALIWCLFNSVPLTSHNTEKHPQRIIYSTFFFNKIKPTWIQ